MGNIYPKAQQEQTLEVRRKLLERLNALPTGSTVWRETVENLINELLQEMDETREERKSPEKGTFWDFSREKSEPCFAGDDRITLRPAAPGDAAFYSDIRAQYSILYKSAYYRVKENQESLFSREALAPQVFFCIIEDKKEACPVGYLGVKDTGAALWEVAIELDRAHTRQGLGPRSIRLYLNELFRITGRSEFQAVVEADNVPSQKCFEGLGAKLVGLCGSVLLKTEEEKERFEEKNLRLIDDHMRELAARLGVEPRKLLSHLLDYRLSFPLRDGAPIK